MPFVAISGLDDVQEEKPVPEGAYDLRIVNVATTDKEGNPMLSKGEDGKPKRSMIRCDIRIEDENYPDARLINHFLVFPVESDEDQTRKLMLRGIKRFLSAFGVEWTSQGFDPEELEGQTASNILVKLVANPREAGSFQNELQLPRLDR